MQPQQINRPDLPPHFRYLDTAESEHWHQELQRELPAGHLLFGASNANHPTIEFDGTFAEFLEREWRLQGLKPQSR